MKLEDAVRKSIYEYPGLYKSENYDQSRLKILNQLFIVLGSGYRFADTKDPKKGGYLTVPSNSKYDPPYGKEKFPQLTTDFFKNKHFGIATGHGAKVVSAYINRDEFDTNLCIEIAGVKPDDGFITGLMKGGEYFMPYGLYLREEISKHPFSPYPIAKISRIGELYYKNLFLQPDWMQGAIDVAKECLAFYSDESRHKYDSYYPTENQNNATLRHFEKTKSERGIKGVKELQKLWGYKESDSIPTMDEMKARSNQCWEAHLKESLDFYTKFTKKYQ